jgi:hypothetical protein
VKKFTAYLFLMMLATQLWAQSNKGANKSVTYEELFDAPYEINKLFVHFQPLYSELFVTNLNIGFGFEAQYYLENKMDFKAHYRQAYTRTLDFTRDVAFRNNDHNQPRYVLDDPTIFNYFEIGATYHIKDHEQDTESKFILYSKTYKGAKWEAKVPEHIKIPTKVRKIIGARLGALSYKSSVDLNRTREAQGVDLVSATDSTLIDPELFVFGNINSLGGYVGASLSMIKNVGIKFDKTYGVAVNDLIFTAFADILVMPMMNLDPVRVMDRSTAEPVVINYPTDQIKTSMLGFRLGMEGKFNREFGWGYGAEAGIRPGISTRTFYAMFKVSFPVYSTTLSHRVEAFGK